MAPTGASALVHKSLARCADRKERTMTPAKAAALGTKVAEMEQALRMSGTINAEAFYWRCIALLIAINGWFLAYEMGASRVKDVLASSEKNILAFAFIAPTMYLFG